MFPFTTLMGKQDNRFAWKMRAPIKKLMSYNFTKMSLFRRYFWMHFANANQLPQWAQGVTIILK